MMEEPRPENKKTESPKPIVCVISASDSSGHAGHQCDLRVTQNLGTHGVGIISGLTAQNSQRISHIEVSSRDSFAAQMESLQTDLSMQAIKVGLLFSADQIQQTVQFAQQLKCPLIVDPVLSSTSGTDFSDNDVLRAYPALIAEASLLTPNIPETEKLLGTALQTTALQTTALQSDEDIISAASQLREMGAHAVLIKGGHRGEKHGYVYDYFDDGERTFWLRQPRLLSQNTRGTGCALASAIASFIALGKELHDAVVLANAYVHQGIVTGFAIGHGAGLLGNGGWPFDFSHYPAVSESVNNFDNPAFASCDTKDLGLYPIVNSLEWLEYLLILGVTTLQLRIKDRQSDELDNLISKAVALGKQYKVRLFINDHWQLAIKHQAYGVHLGQEDMDEAQLQTIQHNGLRLGLSSHSEYEWLRAANFKPSYIAMGSVFPTRTKTVHTIGLANLDMWSHVLAPHFPLVAIGGITMENMSSVLDCGVGSVAIVSAIGNDNHYEQRVRQLQKLLQEHRSVPHCH